MEQFKTLESRKEKFPTNSSRRIFELSEDEEKNLKEKTKQHNGLIRIFVHPNFDPHIKKDPNKSQQMNIAFQKILNSPSKKPPIFIMDSVKEADCSFLYNKKQFPDETIDKYIENSSGTEYESHDGVIIIPTEPYRPVPLLPGARNDEEAFAKLINKLKSLGIKKILIGGTELMVPSKPSGIQYLMSGDTPSIIKHGGNNIMDFCYRCLGATIRELRKDFEIELSSLTAPHSRREINDFTKKNKDLDYKELRKITKEKQRRRR